MKHVHKQQAGKQRRAAARRTKLLTWTAVVGVLGLVLYGISQTSGVPYTDRHIVEVDFTDLTPRQKNTALREANAARCTCGCGLGLAQCVVTDATCPVRVSNIEKIRAMVAKARAAS